MKLKLILLITIITSYTFCFADEYYDDVYHFPGVGSEYKYGGKKYRVEKTSLNTQIQHMDKLYSDGKPKVLMGHSAGGLKAMAYASLLSQKGKKDEVKGVITMGAPLKGFSALAQGKDNLNKKIESKINTIVGAADSLVDVSDSIISTTANLILGIPLPPGYINTAYQISKNNLKSILCNVVGYNVFKRPLDAIIDLDILGDSFVKDISPNSTFMNNYINPRASVKTAGYYRTVKIDTGFGYHEAIWKTKRNCFGWKYSYISGWKWKKIYKTKQVWVDPTYNYYPKIDKKIPIAMIVGQENDPLSALDSDAKNNVKKVMEAVKGSLTAAEVLLHVRSAKYYASIFLIYKGVEYTRKAIKCSDGRKLVENYKSEYGKLLGSTANDCFITEESQHYSLNRLGGISMVRTFSDGKATCSSNHFNEPSHNEIWGEGGSASYDENSPDESKRQRLKYGSIKGGILKKCFDTKDWPVYDRNGEIFK